MPNVTKNELLNKLAQVFMFSKSFNMGFTYIFKLLLVCLHGIGGRCVLNNKSHRTHNQCLINIVTTFTFSEII